MCGSMRETNDGSGGRHAAQQGDYAKPAVCLCSSIVAAVVASLRRRRRHSGVSFLLWPLSFSRMARFVHFSALTRNSGAWIG